MDGEEREEEGEEWGSKAIWNALRKYRSSGHGIRIFDLQWKIEDTKKYGWKYIFISYLFLLILGCKNVGFNIIF